MEQIKKIIKLPPQDTLVAENDKVEKEIRKKQRQARQESKVKQEQMQRDVEMLY